MEQATAEAPEEDSSLSGTPTPGSPGYGSPFSRQMVRAVAAAIAVLLVLGALVGLVTRSTSSKSGTGTTTLGNDAATSPLASLPAATARLMGLTSLHDRVAPPISLVDQHGSPLTLAGLRGRAVVVTFLDTRCTVICPVEAAELRSARRSLGSRADRVAWVAVNVDAAHGTVADMARLTSVAGLGDLPGFHAVTGSFTALRAVWAAYGMQVEVDQTHGVVLYTPLMVFIDPSGHERFMATPFGNEQPDGRSTLPAPQIDQWGRGIAQVMTSLSGAGSS